jgi:DNA-binding transcriptional MerR regulator
MEQLLKLMAAKRNIKGAQSGARTNEKPLRIGAVARQLGISASMIRAWERQGLRRTETPEGAHRFYTKEDIELLCRAIYLRRTRGLNAPAILEQLRGEKLLEGGAPAANKSRLIGKHLRELREERGLSLAEVAKAVEISTGFLSNLERSQTGVSLGIMHRLAQYYGTTLSAIYYESDSPGPFIPKGKGRRLAAGDGVHMELLAWGRIAMEPYIMIIEPGKGSRESYAHHGEEFIYVITGELNIALSGTEYHLGEGDSFYFASNTSHNWHNPGQCAAKVLWINTSATAA